MKFKLLLPFILISVSLLAQEEHNHEIEIITNFISENGLSASEKLYLQCEYHLLYQQYQEESTLDSTNLLTAFQAILSTYRTADTLDTSYRLKELEYDVSNTPRQSSELELFLGPHGSENYARSTTCINTDFESNNFDHWSMGHASDDGETGINPGIDLGPMNGTDGNHAIMGPGAGNDAQTDNILPRVYPGGGQYSLRLGDEQGGYNAAKISYTFNVTPATELFLYHYAVVMEDPGHDPAEQPFLRINLIIDDTSITCGEYYQAASGNADGYTVVDGGFFGDDVLFKPWSTVSIALSPYIGQTATIEFTTSDCAQGGHFGYAYLDAECSSMPTLAEAQLDCSSPTTTIEGPDGAETYEWSGPGIVGSSTDQNVEVNEVGIYTVEVIPVQGPSCSYTREVEVVGNTSDATADFKAVPDEVCLGEEIEFEDLSTSTDPITGYEWQFGDGNSSTLTAPSHTYTAPGTYTVDLTINPLSDCSNTISKDVVVSPLPIVDFMIDSVCFGEGSSIQDLSSIDTINGNVIDNWNWDFGDGQTSTDANPTHQYGNENIFNVELIVTSNNGCINSVIKPTAVYPQPIVDFSPTEVCVEFITDFTDESTVNNTHTSNQNVSWNWDFDDGNTATIQNPSNTYANDGSYNVNLTVTTNHNCTADSTFPVIVNSKPTPDFDFTNACDNESILLESTSTSNASGITAYYWDIDNNSSVEYNTAIANHTYGNEGFHDVVHVVEDANGCRDTITQQITVYALPNANFDVDEVCEDATTTFENTSTITPVDNDVIDQYNWDFGNVPLSGGSTSTVENPTLNYEVENVYDAELIVTTNYGCKDTIVQTVTVYPLPVVDFSPTDLCLDETSQFTDQSLVSNTHTNNSLVSWNWDFDDGNTATIQNPSNTYANDGSYNVNLTVTTNHNCSADSTFPVIVNPKPTPDFDFTNACDNESILLKSTSTSNASGITAYYWDIDNNSSVEYNTAIANHTYGNEGFHDVVHVVEDANGCRDTITQQITVYALPNANFDVDEVCEDATTTFENTSTITPVDNDVIDQYNWDFGNVPSSGSSTSTVENPTLNYEVENVYNAELIVTTNYGCKDTIVQTVTVYPLPFVDFSPTDVCLGETSQFTDQSLVSNAHTNNSLVSWNWDFDDGTTSTIQNPSNTYSSDTTYSTILEVTTNHGCINDTTKTVTVHPLPDVSFTGVNLAGCAPLCPTVTSTTTITSTSSIVQENWTLSDGRTYQGDSFTDCYENETGNTIYYGLNLTVTSSEGCVSSHHEDNYISVYHRPIANFYTTPYEIDIIDPEVSFHNTSIHADYYNWNIESYGSSSDVNPVVLFPSEPTTYDVELIAFTDAGCTDTAYAAIEIKDRIIYYVPNTFTPDNDDYNEVFKPIFSSGYEPQSYTLYIFNRWGEMVFESHNTNIGWDGTYGLSSERIVRDGTYIWKIIFQETMSDKSHAVTGHVNVLR